MLTQVNVPTKYEGITVSTEIESAPPSSSMRWASCWFLHIRLASSAYCHSFHISVVTFSDTLPSAIALISNRRLFLYTTNAVRLFCQVSAKAIFHILLLSAIAY